MRKSQLLGALGSGGQAFSALFLSKAPFFAPGEFAPGPVQSVGIAMVVASM
jgi:hypothetical protein